MTEAAKVAYTISHLLRFRGRASQGVQAGELPVLRSMPAADAPSGGEICIGLCHQLPHTAQPQPVEPGRLVGSFLHGLAAHIKDALVAYDVPSSLDGAIDLAIWVDLRVQACRRERLQRRQLVVAEEFSQ